MKVRTAADMKREACMTRVPSWIAVLFLLLQVPAAYAQSHYVRKEPANKLVVVFVHGVLGNARDTWTHQNGGFWPALLKEDKDFDGANVFVVDYPTPALGKSLSIDELADSMRMTLKSQGVLDHPELVFVMHSMGGLVTRAYLLRSRDIARRVRLLYFFGTPTTGASIASVSGSISANVQFQRMATMTSASYLADAQRNWLNSAELSSLPSFCAYEVQDTLGIKIVEQASALSLCNRPPAPINVNHSGLAKPALRTDPSYATLRNAYVSTGARQIGMLRMELQGVRQVRDTMEKLPVIDGLPVLCDAVRMTLLFAHTQRGTTPIRINAISVHSEPVAAMPALKPGSCAIDTLSSRAHGIVEVDTYLLSSGEKGVQAKLIRNAGVATDVKPENILVTATALPTTRAITLTPGEPPVGFSVLVEAKAKTPRRVWLTAEFDEGGPKTLSTTPIIVWK